MFLVLQRVMPPVREVPYAGDALEIKMHQAECEGDALDDRTWLEVLRKTEEKRASILSSHMPWNVPNTQHTYVPLVHPDFITGVLVLRFPLL